MSDQSIAEMFKLFQAMQEMPEDQREEILGSVTDGKNKGYWRGKKRSESYSDFHEFFTKKYPNTKRDLFRGVGYTKDLDQYKDWEPIENCLNAIESQCAEYGLSPTFVKRHLSQYIKEMQPELLVEIPEWDGKDHIKDALDRITVTNIDHEHFVELMKDWFSKIVRRMYQPKVQNRLPIFRGKQGLGKDFSIRAMTEGFGRYANEIDFQQSNKTEVYRIIKNLAVGIIPEFDETNTNSISVLKSVITAESIELRALYKNESESIPIRTSFISASNFEDVLRDSSGNRRFLLFDISHIDHTFESVDGGQIAAQSYELAKEKYRPSAHAEESMRAIVQKETPQPPDKLFADEVNMYLAGKYQDLTRDKMDAMLGKISAGSEHLPDRIRWPHIAEDVARIAKKYRFGVKKTQQIINRHGMTHTDDKSSWYLPHSLVN